MAEYIKRETAIAWFMPYAHAGESIDADVVISDIKGMKTADVAPVRHGKWTSIGYDCGENEYQCSECRRTEWRESADDMKFCMFCGAMMDGGADNER